MINTEYNINRKMSRYNLKELIMTVVKNSILAALCLVSCFITSVFSQDPLFKDNINVNPPAISTDDSVKYDYDIVYVRALRDPTDKSKRFYTDFSQPVTLQPGADLMLLHPNGTEELLVAGGLGSITDPIMSFDGKWVYYVHLYNLQKRDKYNPDKQGADIFKINLETKRIVRLTNQKFTPNTGAAPWSTDYRTAQVGKTYINYGVFNMGPHPLPGGKIVFTSNRDAFIPNKGEVAVALQLFVIDDADTDVDVNEEYPRNIEKIGHLNIGGALHPVVLADGRIMFSTQESQGIRSGNLWGLWTINPDGTGWGPLVSAFEVGGAASGFHFQTQLSDKSVISEIYYIQNNSGFGAYVQVPESGIGKFGDAGTSNPINRWRFGRFGNGVGKWYDLPFTPIGSTVFTPFARQDDGPADVSIATDPTSIRVGKVTHPSGAPDNHMLTIWSPGAANHQYLSTAEIDGGIYLIKDGKPIDEPGKMRLIKNDPLYNESWPRAVVPYKRIYGVDEPTNLNRLANNGQLSPHLPEGTPYGLVGTSSIYKRDSYPRGVVLPGTVVAAYAGGTDPWKGLDPFMSKGKSLNWTNQGSDSGLYENKDIHAIRIVGMEATTDRKIGAKAGRLFYNVGTERLRVLGEIPVRKFTGDNPQPLDPDGNPDTSFLAKIPADVPFTFQILNRDGIVLNSSQTWHQLRPGEIRHDCGGCHAHSQQPTLFSDTLAAKPDYSIFDLTKVTPLLTSKGNDESQRKWDKDNSTGLRNYTGGVVTPEWNRDILPIITRSCSTCHTKNVEVAPGNLVFDDITPTKSLRDGYFPNNYYRLVFDGDAKFGIKPVGLLSWGFHNNSRYVRQLRSMRSLLAWKIYGKRMDGFTNDDFPSESKPGAGDLVHRGASVPIAANQNNADIDFLGSVMPPPEAVAEGKAQALSDDDRRTIVRWIDLGCPIDRDYDSANPTARGYGWMLDDQRPTLTMLSPQPGLNKSLNSIIIGVADSYTGVDMNSLSVKSDININDIGSGENLAPHFVTKSDGVWELPITKPLIGVESARLIVSIKDKQGNENRIDRKFSTDAPTPEEIDAAVRLEVAKRMTGKLYKTLLEVILDLQTTP